MEFDNFTDYFIGIAALASLISGIITIFSLIRKNKNLFYLSIFLLSSGISGLIYGFEKKIFLVLRLLESTDTHNYLFQQNRDEGHNRGSKWRVLIFRFH